MPIAKKWWPITCDCCVEELYEGSEIVGMGKVVSKCIPHTSVADEDLYGVLIANPDSEQLRIRDVGLALLNQEGDLALGLEKLEVDPADGLEKVVGLKDGVTPKFSFEGEGANRLLKVEIEGATLTKEQADSLTAYSDSKFGAGKVEIM